MDDLFWNVSWSQCGGLDLLKFDYQWINNSFCQRLLDNEVPHHTIDIKDTDSYPTPMAPGGLFAMNRAWWIASGRYDPGMKVWGSEHIEQAIRLWTCGGSVRFVPCSNVGHVFRRKLFYTTTPEELLQIWDNIVRAAMVWLDETYLKAVVRLLPNLRWREVEEASLQPRYDLKDSLGCRDFEWYVDKIDPRLRELLAIARTTDLAKHRSNANHANANGHPNNNEDNGHESNHDHENAGR
mmetsp:Transcript_19567/g.42251  ORF Transcript_19567/g.42251 Transcript_19567/m.42251 type:complete len:239 (-) Transcript_19567:100-816(-)